MARTSAGVAPGWVSEGTQSVLFVNGVRVAAIDSNGLLRLVGYVQTNTAL